MLKYWKKAYDDLPMPVRFLVEVPLIMGGAFLALLGSMYLGYKLYCIMGYWLFGLLALMFYGYFLVMLGIKASRLKNKEREKILSGQHR